MTQGRSRSSGDDGNGIPAESRAVGGRGEPRPGEHDRWHTRTCKDRGRTPVTQGVGAMGPMLVILVVLAGLALFMRWAFGSGCGRSRRPPDPADAGLLVRVATVSAPEIARALRAVLSDAGIRSTQRTAAQHR